MVFHLYCTMDRIRSSRCEHHQQLVKLASWTCQGLAGLGTLGKMWESKWRFNSRLIPPKPALWFSHPIQPRGCWYDDNRYSNWDARNFNPFLMTHRPAGSPWEVGKNANGDDRRKDNWIWHIWNLILGHVTDPWAMRKGWKLAGGWVGRWVSGD